MPTYITLIKFTPQGLSTIKDAPKRLDAARQRAKSMGGDLKAFYLTMGRYDAVVIAESPNDEAVARNALLNGQMGNIQTETLRAFTEDEYRKIVASLP
jgi:uncharacterized protein with GYD domain